MIPVKTVAAAGLVVMLSACASLGDEDRALLQQARDAAADAKSEAMRAASAAEAAAAATAQSVEVAGQQAADAARAAQQAAADAEAAKQKTERMFALMQKK